MMVSLVHFEQLVQSAQHKEACSCLLDLLASIDNNTGQFGGIEVECPSDWSQMQRDEHICIRLANAIAWLFADPRFNLNGHGFLYFMCLQRWLSMIFGVTDQRNADAVIRQICNAPAGARDIQIAPQNLHKCLVLFTVESQLPINLDALWVADPVATGHLAFAWLATSLMMSPYAHQKREVLLAGFPAKLNELIERSDGQAIFSQWPLQVAHSVYMLCSYGVLASRHAIKGPLNQLLRQYLLDRGLGDVPAPKTVKPNHLKAVSARNKALQALAQDAQTANNHARTHGKPLMLVVTEWFSPGFAVYRTHSETLRAMRDKFHLVGVGPAAGANAAGQAVFHEFFATPRPQVSQDPLAEVRFVHALAARLQPQIVYHLGVGMFSHTMWLSNLRLAPLQLVSNGHGASTHSPHIDYFMTDAGYMSSATAFGEGGILPMPAGVMSMIPNKDIPKGLDQRCTRVPRASPDVVRVVIAAAVIKMNPVFINTLKQIADASPTPVEFHFPMAQAVGAVYVRIKTEIEAILGNRAFVYAHQMYPEYLHIIGECDMFVNPFPYGNTNGIADMALMGMPGICKAGPELAEHIDVGMFRTLGLPEWCIAWTQQDYIQAALRMINNHEERTAIATSLIQGHAFGKLNAHQRPEGMGEILLKLL